MTTDTPSHMSQIVDARWLEPARRKKATLILSLAILAALLFAFLHPDSMSQNESAFGSMASNLGLPLRLIVSLIVCVAYIPIPFAFWHLFGLVFMGVAEGGSIGKVGMIRSVFSVPSRHPELRFSRFVVLLILGGYIAAMFTYAFLADERDIERERKNRTKPTGANKTDAGNGSKAICRVSNVLRSPSPDPRRSPNQ